MSDLQLLAQFLRNFKKDEFKNLMDAVLKNHEAREIIDEFFIPSLNETRTRYYQDKIAIPELLLSIQLLLNLLSKIDMKKLGKAKPYSKIVLGVIEGDPHDMGKNIVKRVYECYGLEIYDLGKDTPVHSFADKAHEIDADIVGISTMMSTTVEKVCQAIQLIRKKSPNTRIMVGGAFMTSIVAKEIGADGYAESAGDLIEETDKIFSNKKSMAHVA